MYHQSGVPEQKLRFQAELAGHEEPQQAPHLRRWDASDPAEMLQEVMQHVFAVTGYAVYGMGPDGNRYDTSGDLFTSHQAVPPRRGSSAALPVISISFSPSKYVTLLKGTRPSRHGLAQSQPESALQMRQSTAHLYKTSYHAYLAVLLA